MELNNFLSELKANDIRFSVNEPMKDHTTFKIGGNADCFITADTVDTLKTVLKLAEEYGVDVFIIGNGSNILVSDDGVEGVVVALKGIDFIKLDGDDIICGAGAKLSAVCNFALENSLTGLEFAFGIPASIGGAAFMNAGAYGGEMSQILKSAKCIDKSGKEVTLERSQMDLGYRKSAFKNNGLIITEVTLSLEKGDKAEISAKMEDFFSRRREKQPLEYPSAGSVFKRPEGYFAGALIEQNGLKGLSVGDAEVSVKHAGFIINKGSASCKETLELIEKIKKTVFKNNGVCLETEVIFVGRE